MADSLNMHLTGLISLRSTAGKNADGEGRVREVTGNVERATVKPGETQSSQGTVAPGTDLPKLSGSKLGMCVATEVMGWRLDHDAYTDSWIDADGKLTGYYYGRPFSPYRDRNALKEVLDRIESLGLCDAYLEELRGLLDADADVLENTVMWALHTCPPDLACLAAIRAVRRSRDPA